MKLCISSGYAVSGSAAIVGNLSQEVGPNLPTRFTLVTDHGSQGLAQWRLSRLVDLENWAEKQNLPVTDMKTQMGFLFHELERDYPQLNKMLKEGTRPIANLTANFMLWFERPNKDPEINRLDKRIHWANECAAAFKGGEVEQPGISDDQIVGIPTLGGAVAIGASWASWGPEAALTVFIVSVAIVLLTVLYTKKRSKPVQTPLEPQHEAFPELDEVAAAIAEMKSAQARMEAAKAVLLMHRNKADALLAQFEEKK